MKRESFCLGVVHYVSFPDTIMGRGAIAPTLEEILRIDEVQAVEITWIRDKAQRRAVKELLDLWNGVVVYSGAPILALSHKSLCSLDKALRSESVDVARQIIDEADYFDADFVLLISGPDPGIQRRHEARSALIESLITLVHYAEAVNGQLMVTLEPADRDIHRRQLIGPISESVEISKAVREHYRRFGLTIDLSHLAQLGEDARQAISMARG